MYTILMQFTTEINVNFHLQENLIATNKRLEL